MGSEDPPHSGSTTKSFQSTSETRNNDAAVEGRSYHHCSRRTSMRIAGCLLGICLALTATSLFYNVSMLRRGSIEMTEEALLYHELGRVLDLTSSSSADDEVEVPRIPPRAEAQATRPFPRWGETFEIEDEQGIDFGPILDFILNSSVYAYAPKNTKHPDYHPTYDHQEDMNYWFPETLYILDKDGIWMSEKHRNITHHGKGSVEEKLVPFENLIQEAWHVLHAKDQDGNRWSRLRQVLSKRGSGFPFLAWFGDYTGCNLNNWKHGHSIPLFTTSANVGCHYTFPMVNYQTVRDAREKENEWVKVMREYQRLYPWPSKHPKVVWRGSLTGKMSNATSATHKSPRWNMLQLVQNLADPASSLLDVGATRLPNRNKEWKRHLHDVGGIVPGIQPMRDFQEYRGILDVDGNSWSSRFGKLLCYNSVVLKVEPVHVDYFYFKREDPLMPWKHYIPVASNFSDLVHWANFVADDANENVVRDIVKRANSWCRRNLIHGILREDVLHIMDRYVQLLDVGSPNWQEHWKISKEDIHSSPLKMTLLEEKISE